MKGEDLYKTKDIDIAKSLQHHKNNHNMHSFHVNQFQGQLGKLNFRERYKRSRPSESKPLENSISPERDVVVCYKLVM